MRDQVDEVGGRCQCQTRCFTGLYVRELAQVVASHVRFDFHPVGAPAAVEAHHHAAHRLEQDAPDHRCVLPPGLLPWLRLPGLAQAQQWGRLPPCRRRRWLQAVCSAASAAPPTGPPLVQVKDKVGELEGHPLLLCFHSFYSWVIGLF